MSPLPTPHESSNGLKRDSGGVRLFSDSKNVILVHSDDDDERGGGQVAKRQSRPDLGCRRRTEQLWISICQLHAQL